MSISDRYRFRRRDRSASRPQAKWSTLVHLRALGRGDPPRQAALEPTEPPRDVTSKSPIDCKQCSESRDFSTVSIIFKVRGQRKQSFCMITKATSRHMQGYICPPRPPGPGIRLVIWFNQLVGLYNTLRLTRSTRVLLLGRGIGG